MTNRMSRRGFFTVLFSAMAAGTIATCPALGAAIEQFGLNESKEIGNPDKIANLLKMYRKIVAMKAASAPVDQEIGEMLKYSNAWFDPAMATMTGVRLVIDEPAKLGINHGNLDEVMLSKMAEGLVPVAVVRAGIVYNKLNFSPKNKYIQSPWDDFVRSYSSLICNDPPSSTLGQSQQAETSNV